MPLENKSLIYGNAGLCLRDFTGAGRAAICRTGRGRIAAGQEGRSATEAAADAGARPGAAGAAAGEDPHGVCGSAGIKPGADRHLRVWSDGSGGCAERSEIRLHQRSCFAAAEIPGRLADPYRDHSGRNRKRRDDHADGKENGRRGYAGGQKGSD